MTYVRREGINQSSRRWHSPESRSEALGLTYGPVAARHAKEFILTIEVVQPQKVSCSIGQACSDLKHDRQVQPLRNYAPIPSLTTSLWGSFTARAYLPCRPWAEPYSSNLKFTIIEPEDTTPMHTTFRWPLKIKWSLRKCPLVVGKTRDSWQ